MTCPSVHSVSIRFQFAKTLVTISLKGLEEYKREGKLKMMVRLLQY